MAVDTREQSAKVIDFTQGDPMLARMRLEAEDVLRREPELGGFIHPAVLAQDSVAGVVTHRVAQRLDRPEASYAAIRQAYEACLARDPSIAEAFRADLLAVVERDPACTRLIEPALYFKGFHALQTYRLAHWLWKNGRSDFALTLQSLSSQIFQTDIHPAAVIGKGVFIDHATGVVIGATSVIEDDVSMLHGVTLGGTGKARGDRHPKVRRGVLIGAGAKVLGNIEIGRCAMIAAGSVVLDSVPANKTVAGVPARIVGDSKCAEPALAMDQMLAVLDAGM
ncbi:serine O-acetyltransferase [Methylocystis sp. WRRC1]|uniref:serine O-acetyltransferase n=1 Tax=unclassified Methylocystis TaxID=2625913 RepID=UPI0001F86F0A|nr:MULTISPECIES: serine O-acetyltransferase [unclassified Methylocystis]MCC3246861.1 serine O-acetyltransferase [Methylocystis sp. WRRC1]